MTVNIAGIMASIAAVASSYFLVDLAGGSFREGVEALKNRHVTTEKKRFTRHENRFKYWLWVVRLFAFGLLMSLLAAGIVYVVFFEQPPELKPIAP